MPSRSYSLPPLWPTYTSVSRRRRPEYLRLATLQNALRTLRHASRASEDRTLLDAVYAIISPPSFDRILYRALLLDLAAQRPRLIDALHTRDSELRTTARVLYSRISPHVARLKALETPTPLARPLRSLEDLSSSLPEL